MSEPPSADDLSAIIAGSEIPILLIGVESGVIVKNNATFSDRYGDFSQRSLYDLFAPFYADQLRWLLQSGSIESDKVIFDLSAATKISGEVMVQYWPIDHRLALLSVLNDYGTDRLADLDALTGLPNRRKSEVLLDIEMGRLSRSNGFCLALADIDFFKSINDRHGHDTGDEVLQYVAQTIASELRGGDWVARWGGEEFLIFIHNNDLITGMQPIERIRRYLSETSPPMLPEQKVTMSFGLVSSSSANDIATLIKKADILLYEAKHSGRNRTAWEEGDEATWVLDNIQHVIDERRLRPAYSALRRWDGGVDAAFVKHSVDDLPAGQVRKLLSAADRLLMRAELDKLLIEKTQKELPTTDKTPVLLPISGDMLMRNFAAVKKMFEGDPRLVAAILSNAVMLNDSWEKFFATDIPFALFNFDPRRTPVYLLAQKNLRFIIYPNPQPPEYSIVNMAAAKFYRVTPADWQPTTEELSHWQDNGFAGYLQMEEKDSLAALLASSPPIA